MVEKIDAPSLIEAAGSKTKVIREFVGRVNSGSSKISIAQMKSPAGWAEPGQRPEFEEYTIVLKGILIVETEEERFELKGGQAILVGSEEWVRYSSPDDSGAEYISVCLPAFSPDTVNRDDITI